MDNFVPVGLCLVKLPLNEIMRKQEEYGEMRLFIEGEYLKGSNAELFKIGVVIKDRRMMDIKETQYMSDKFILSLFFSVFILFGILCIRFPDFMFRTAATNTWKRKQ